MWTQKQSQSGGSEWCEQELYFYVLYCDEVNTRVTNLKARNETIANEYEMYNVKLGEYDAVKHWAWTVTGEAQQGEEWYKSRWWKGT